MKQIGSLTCVLFVTLLSGHKIDKTLIFTVQTMVNLKSVSSHCATKYRSVSYNETIGPGENFPNFFIHSKEIHIVLNNLA